MLRGRDTRPVRADKNQIFVNNKDEAWIKRLEQLVRLKKIFITDGYFGTKLPEVGPDVVLRNAATLTLLHMRSEWLPFDPKRPVVFSNLRDLKCSGIDPDQAAACPRLVKLRTRTCAVEVLQKLPAETITSLHITDLCLYNRSPEEMEQLVAAFSRLTRLKSLILEDGLRDFPARLWSDLHDAALSKLFTNMKGLEEVDITFPEHRRVNVDAMIEMLAHNCPSMRSIRMSYARMTDAGLRSLSRLTGLQHLDIRNWRWQSLITTEGILSLLRGGSRNVLRDLELKVSVSPDLDPIRAEGQLIQQETGQSLSVEVVKKSNDVHYNFRIVIRG